MADKALTDRQRLERLEAAVAQLAGGMRQSNGWRPELHKADAVTELIAAAGGGGVECRPHMAPETRRAA